MKKFLFILCLLPSLVWAAECVKVETRDGAPCITVDGTPVRPRVFYGGTCVTPLEIGTETTHFDFTFRPRIASGGRGTLHFRFGKEPGTIFIDNLSITEVETGAEVMPVQTFDTPDAWNSFWHVWDAQAQGVTTARYGIENGALRVEILPTKIQNDFHIFSSSSMNFALKKEYRVQMDVRASETRKLWATLYKPGNPYQKIGGAGQDLFAAQIGMAREAGAPFVSFATPSIWPDENGKVDWAAIDQSLATVLEANPDALLMPRIGMSAPEWWLRKNPTEVMRWTGLPEEVLAQKSHSATVSSVKYREFAARTLLEAVRHMEAKFGPHMAGYHPCGQNTGEWFTLDSWHAGRAGYAEADRVAWREWLRKRYGTDGALRAAWGDDTISLETVEVPPFTLFQESIALPVLNPEQDKKFAPVVDFNFFMQEQMSDMILALGSAIRQGTDGRRLSMFFYGYNFEFGAIYNGPAYSAHYGLQRVLDSDVVDVLCSPQSYFDRQPGGGGPCMLPAESVALAGKMYLLEDDTRTHRTPELSFPGAESGGETLEETCALLRRNTGECVCRNFACWWMDLGSSGWYADPGLWVEMSKIAPLDESFLKHPTPYRPEVGVFLDEAAMMRLTTRKFALDMVYKIREPLGRLGTPYGQYLSRDLLEGRMGVPKLCVFLHPQCYSAEQRRALELAAEGATVLWVDSDGTTVETLRDAARRANVHLYTQENCNVWANGPILVLHASQDGTVHVSPKSPFTRLCDAYTLEEVVGPLEMKLGETRILLQK